MTCEASDIAARRAIRLVRPRTDNQLAAYVRLVLGFRVSRRPIMLGHQAPFAYIRHAFFEEPPEPPGAPDSRDSSVSRKDVGSSLEPAPRDCIVWANRGGGKTQLGAVATLLDLIFKPGIQIRILGGSFEQSSKMYRYLKQILEDDVFSDLIDGKLTGRAVELINGSRVEVLSQSERAVRGQRVHKLRCDEVELFEPDVWAAAQMVTRSGQCGDTYVRGSIEALSTMHRPFGLMNKLVREAKVANRLVFRWSVMDAIARCEPSRSCESCLLWDDCKGRAKEAGGFITVDDAIQQRRRVDGPTWQAEMLCLRPSRTDTVYPEFNVQAHVRAFEVPEARDAHELELPGAGVWIGGIDFGYRDPTVLLWAWVDADGLLHIVDELIDREQTTQQHIEAAHARPWPRPSWIGADPAGHQRSEQTGVSSIAVWNRTGWPMRTQSMGIEAGVSIVRARFRNAAGESAIVIHPRCTRLIESLTMYHYPPDKPECSTPEKDGHDHAADALRYMIVNLDRPMREVTVRGY